MLAQRIEQIEQFRTRIMGAGMLKGDLKQYWTFFHKTYLNNHIRKAWRSIIVKVVEGLHKTSTPEEPQSDNINSIEFLLKWPNT